MTYLEFKKLVEETAGPPVNNAGGGNVAGLGPGAGGAPPGPAGIGIEGETDDNGADFIDGDGDGQMDSLFKRHSKLGQKKKRPDELAIAGPAEQFAGYDVFEVPKDVYDKCLQGKTPYHRWQSYVGNDAIGTAIRDYALKNRKKPFILKDKSTGAMIFARHDGVHVHHKRMSRNGEVTNEP